MYDSRLVRWSTYDPMAEKYYGVNAYGYCAGNPVMMADPDGENWYSYLDEEGTMRYKYFEGQLSEDEIKEKGYTDLGYSYYDDKNGVYYSLFGNIVPTKNDKGQRIIEGELYRLIDNLLIKNYGENKANAKESFYFGVSPGDFPFEYNGNSFYSNIDGTVFHILNNEDNSKLHIEKTPKQHPVVRFGFFGKKYQGYFIVLSNDKGYDVIQISFDETNVTKYHSALKAIFK